MVEGPSQAAARQLLVVNGSSHVSGMSDRGSGVPNGTAALRLRFGSGFLLYFDPHQLADEWTGR